MIVLGQNKNFRRNARFIERSGRHGLLLARSDCCCYCWQGGHATHTTSNQSRLSQRRFRGRNGLGQTRTATTGSRGFLRIYHGSSSRRRWERCLCHRQRSIRLTATAQGRRRGKGPCGTFIVGAARGFLKTAASQLGAQVHGGCEGHDIVVAV